MRRQWATMLVGSLIWLSVLLILSLPGFAAAPASQKQTSNGCSPSTSPTPGQPFPAYNGCRLPRDQVAVVIIRGARATYVDQVFTYNGTRKAGSNNSIEHSDSLELLPGHHSIRFAPYDPLKGRTFEEHLSREINVDEVMDAQAGKTYTAVWREQNTGAANRQQQYWVEIAELRPDASEYLQLYQDCVKEGDSAAALSALETYLALFPKDADHKTYEAKARQLRAALSANQVDAYRAVNTKPQKSKSQSAQAKPASSPKSRGCMPEQQGHAFLRPAIGLTVRGATDGPTPKELLQVLSRATDYVQKYQVQLGNMIGEEVYVQSPLKPYRAPSMFPAEQKIHRTDSDFAIVRLGTHSVGVREVHCVDGNAVRHESGDLQNAIDASADASRKNIDDILRENAKYNIGLIQRNTNLPTFALQILLPENVTRFEFHKTGESSIAGVRTWSLAFLETRGPTLIHDGDNNEEFVEGTLWIEPQTGRVLKTDVRDSGHQTGNSFSAETIVSYRNEPRLGLLVPVQMTEHYDLNGSPVLDCQADYSNFHRFQVEAKFNFGKDPDAGQPSTSPVPADPKRPTP